MIEITSAFPPDGEIPSKYTCDGMGLSPPLAWSGVPDDARSLAILVDDPDASDQPFLHWLVTDVPPSVRALDEGGALPHESQIGETDAGTASYYGPCPTSGRHRYRFHLYALDTVLGHRPQSRDQFLSEIAGHIIDEGELVGTYQRMRDPV
jgi:Raf kinase inhibitor-like YbhB/YbcL family protein